MSFSPRRKASFALAVVSLLAGFGTPEAAQPRLPAAYGASGSFLAAIVANAGRDSGSTAEFFREALRADPRNAALLDQTFGAELVNGNLDEAFRLAAKATQRESSNTLAQVVLAVREMRARNYDRAAQRFTRAGGPRQADLALSMFRAFALTGQGKAGEALRMLDRFPENDARALRDYFSGLVADIAGQTRDAEARLERAYKAESALMRIADAYARVLSRMDKPAEAKAVLLKWKGENPTQPFFDPLLASIEKGEKLPPLTSTPAEGLGEVFYMLGALGQGQRDAGTALTYLQLARYLSPGEDIYRITLAEFFEQGREYARAAELYATVSASSPYVDRAAIGRAALLDRLEKTDEAVAVLRALLGAHPKDYEAADTLGAILRSKKRWSESVEVYDAILKALPKLEQRHFVLLFGRAVGYERLKQWSRAEPDFLGALDLLPAKPRTPREAAERAQVLNYLAYSWVDNGMNIEKSFDMLREAVSITPGDGAVVDSLGWAYFRLGKYADAVRELERAVLLKGGDPTINDHLGDAYFKVGRVREAEFKWRQALELNPEPEDAVKIRLKLDKGFEAAVKGG